MKEAGSGLFPRTSVHPESDRSKRNCGGQKAGKKRRGPSSRPESLDSAQGEGRGHTAANQRCCCWSVDSPNGRAGCCAAVGRLLREAVAVRSQRQRGDR